MSKVSRVPQVPRRVSCGADLGKQSPQPLHRPALLLQVYLPPSRHSLLPPPCATIASFIPGGSLSMSSSAAPTHEQTLKNLLAAFNGESNAAAHYAAFAVKADAEGYLKVGS